MLIAYFAAIIPYWSVTIIGLALMVAGIVILVENVIPIGFDIEKKVITEDLEKITAQI